MILEQKKWPSKGKMKAMNKLVAGQGSLTREGSIKLKEKWNVYKETVGQGCFLLGGPHTVPVGSSEPTRAEKGSPLHCSLSARYLRE